MIEDVYEKIKNTNIQRYYVLSTVYCNDEEKSKIDKKIKTIQAEHGCQVIINGIFETLRYYLRLLNNTDEFVCNYVKMLEENTKINFEHKIAWNRIVNMNYGIN